MKIKWGMFITDGVGKIGGHVVQRNHYGPFARTLVVPANPQSAFQQDRRGQFEYLTQNWRALSDTRRTLWSVDSLNYPLTDPLGNTYFATGINHYISLNLNLWLIGQAFLVVPAVKRIPADPGTFSGIIKADGSQGKLIFDIAPTDAASQIVVYGTNGMSPGIYYVSSKYRSLTNVTPDGVTVSFNIGTAYYNLFPTPVIDTKAWLKILPIDTASGCPGLPASVSVIIT